MPKQHKMSEMTAHPSRRFFFSPDFLISIFLLVITIIIFRFTNLDLTIQKLFYNQQGGWFLRDWPLFRLVYHYGNLPALLLAIAALVLFGLSFKAYKWAKWRKIGLFLALAMLIGPGLIINAALKDNWGRPRPRNVTDFGGKYNYEQVLDVDTTSPGSSFPCGHASMGFYLFIPWFVIRKRKHALALLSLTGGILYGLLIGIARMAQGGHWASDVIIAGLLVYLVGAVLYYLLKLNIALLFYTKAEFANARHRTIVFIIIALFMGLLLIGVALATPYSKSKTFHSQELSQYPIKYTMLTMNLEEGEMEILPADSIYCTFDIQGFGFPRSKYDPTFREEVSRDTLRLHLEQRRKGFFTELVNNVYAVYPFNNSNLDLSIRKGKAKLTLPDSLHDTTLNIRIKDGMLDLDLPSTFKPRIKLKGDFALKDSTDFTSHDDIYIREDFRVNLIVEKGEIYLH